ncbi:helix-turn-helix domain-containing protein [Elizabethkingia occulta]|uniref:helix-turn-helix domain-containing protein n=1 Tax=Elizabethkingia occulta TaxID=1867263 RepID=UPI00099913E0|nr:helix-turn-helix domain-containing protein [Elizabethkingia occulta]OPB92542.1 AraC family transcriptional regulator [Elizabethkingia occulta]
MFKKAFLLFTVFFTILTRAQDNYEVYNNVHRKILHETAQKDFNKALIAADSLYKATVTPPYKVRSLLLIATLYEQKNDLEKAINYAQKGEEIAEKANDYDWLSRIYGFIASQYRILKMYDKCRLYIEKAVAASKKIDNPVQSYKVNGLMLQLLARINMEQGNFQKAINRFKKAQENFDKIPSKEFFTASNNQLLGSCYLNAKLYDQAINCYKNALVYTDVAMPGSAMSGTIYQELCLAYVRKGELDEAKKYLDRAKKYASKSQYAALDKEIYNTAQEYYAIKKDINNFAIATVKKDSLSEKIITQKSKFVNNKYQNLERQNALEKRNSSTKSLLIGISLVFIIVNLLFTIAYRKRQKKQVKKIQHVIEGINKELKQKYNKPIEASGTFLISVTTEHSLLEKLKTFESQNRFTDRNMSLSYMASTMDTNTKYLSYIIKKYRNKDFTTYTNELRINYILDKLNNDPTYRKYKISILAEDAGFSSHSMFTTNFKTITGVSPSEFIKYIQKRDIHSFVS